MKRQPKSEKAKDTKKAILEAAAHIMLKEGFEKVNTNHVAERAGVSVGSLYQYYANKEEMFDDLLLGLLDRREARLRKAMDLSVLTRPAADIIERVVEALLEEGDGDEARLEMLLLPLMFRSANEKLMIQRSQRMEDFARPLVKAFLAVKNPKLMKRDLDIIVFVLIQAMRGVVLGTGLPQGLAIPKKKLKEELSLLLKVYLDVGRS
jgi:AcrR family transcriptional regulator